MLETQKPKKKEKLKNKTKRKVRFLGLAKKRLGPFVPLNSPMKKKSTFFLLLCLRKVVKTISSTY